MVDNLTYRTFASMPLPAFVQQVRAQLLEHGQPEMISDLRHAHIDKNEYFEILCEIDIDPLKRPEADLAPCPMCQPNKFLRGRLCYFPRLQCCAIIGHCCANKEHSAAAERRFKEASVLKWQEDYFLAAMPLIPEKLRVLRVMSAKAAEVQAVHRKFRKDGNETMMLLRDAVKGGGQLQIHFELERAASGTGPQGFRGGNRVFDTVDYGVLEGTVAIRAKYDPVAEVEHMLQRLTVWNVGESEEQVIEAIASMNQRQRNTGYAVLTDIDHSKWPKFARAIEDFLKFFEPENLTRLKRWGADTRNSTPLKVWDQPASDGYRSFFIMGAGRLAKLTATDTMWLPVPDWPVVPKRS